MSEAGYEEWTPRKARIVELEAEVERLQGENEQYRLHGGDWIVKRAQERIGDLVVENGRVRERVRVLTDALRRIAALEFDSTLRDDDLVEELARVAHEALAQTEGDDTSLDYEEMREGLPPPSRMGDDG